MDAIMNRRPCRVPLKFALIGMLLGAAMNCIADSPTPMATNADTNLDPATGAKSSGSNIVVAPIPVSNPSIGSGLALAGMLLYQVDDKSPASFTGLGGAYTSSDSWAAAVAEKLYFLSDTFRLSAGVGTGQVNYDYFGVGNGQNSSGIDIPLRQHFLAGLLDFRMKVFQALHIGLRWRFGNIDTSVHGLEPPLGPIINDKQLNLVISGLGPVASWDTRDRPFAPSHGIFAEFRSSFQRKAFGSDLQYETYSLSANGYHPVPFRDSDVIAARVYLCRVSDSAPFFDICSFGSGVDLRGYEAGRYRDFALIAGQAEYRLSLARRFGAVAFAGAGTVAPNFGSLGSGKFLPSVGLGARYLAAPKQGVMLSADFAWGADGSSGLYVYIGDSF
jgi:outer membrane protein assembly factor BamA